MQKAHVMTLLLLLLPGLMRASSHSYSGMASFCLINHTAKGEKCKAAHSRMHQQKGPDKGAHAVATLTTQT